MLVNADACRIPLPDESVHMVVTSPPYFSLRSYSGQQELVWGGEAGCAHEWGDQGIKKSSGGPCVLADAGQAMTDARYFEASTGSYCLRCGAWRGCLGLEPTPEQYCANMVAIFREVWRVLRLDGTCWLNLGDSYAGGKTGRTDQDIHSRTRGNPGDGLCNFGEMGQQRSPPPGLKPKDLCMIPARVAFALQADGWWLRSDIIWHKPNPMPESVTDRPTKAHEYLFLLSKSARYFYDADAVREGFSEKEAGWIKSGAGVTCFGLNGPCRPGDDKQPTSTLGGRPVPAGRNRRTVWTIATQAYSGSHFATFPCALVEPCIKAGTSQRGVCPECGAPWERVVDVDYTESAKKRGTSKNTDGKFLDAGAANKAGGWGDYPSLDKNVTTTGWLPSCDCYGGTDIPRRPDMPEDAEPPVYCEVCGGAGEIPLWGWAAGQIVRCTACKGKGITRKPNRAWLEWQAECAIIDAQRAALVEEYADCPTDKAVILDPFVGSGTALVVARALGRRGIGLDLSYPYLYEQARVRLGLDKLEQWGAPLEAEPAWSGLPLFQGEGE